MLGPSHFAGAGRDALPRVRRLYVSTLLLAVSTNALLRYRSWALSHALNEVFAFLGRAMSDRAGARPYVRLRVRTNRGVEVPIGQNTGCP